MNLKATRQKIYAKMTSAFDLFELIESDPTIESGGILKCTHKVIIKNHGLSVCRDCGIEQDGTGTSDWKSHGINELKHTMNPTHFCSRKVKDKNIYGDITYMDISDNIKDLANDIYNEACKDKVHRGSKRRAIVFASLFHAYKHKGIPKSCDTLIGEFKIPRKDALKGLKFVNFNCNNIINLDLYITPEHLISEFLGNFMVSVDKKDEIISIYKKIESKSSILNRSRPQSVASGVIWYWIKKNHKQISIKEFTKTVDLSELTVLKMAKEVERFTL